MATTFNDADLASNDSSGTALACAAVTVTAGDLVVLFGKHEGAVDASASVSWDQTVNEQGSIANRAHANTDLNGRIWYGRATASGTIVGTLNTPGSRAFRKVHVYTFTPTAGQKLVFDVEAASGSGTSSSGTTSGWVLLLWLCGFLYCWFWLDRPIGGSECSRLQSVQDID
jgi:hypothetical protein